MPNRLQSWELAVLAGSELNVHCGESPSFLVVELSASLVCSCPDSGFEILALKGLGVLEA